MPPFSRITRYVLGELLPPTLLGIGLYSFVLMMNYAFFVAKDAVAKDLDPGTVARLLLYFLPNVLILSIPMGTLLGTLVGVGRLSGDHELVALQAAGGAPMRLVRPVLIHGSLATLASAVVYLCLQPAANDRLYTLKSRIATINVASDLRPRVFCSELPGVVLYVDDIPAGSGRMRGVLLYQADDGLGSEQLTIAREGELVPSREPNGAISLELRDGIAHSFKTEAPETYRPTRFGVYQPKPFQPLSYLAPKGGRPRKFVQQMPLRELLREIRRIEDEREPLIREIRRRYAWVELHQRIALPLACLLFALLALPLGVGRGRSGRAAGFALSLAVVLVYWVAFTTMRDQSWFGNLPPGIGVWSGNIAVAAWAAIAYVRFRKTGGARTGFGTVSEGLKKLFPPGGRPLWGFPRNTPRFAPGAGRTGLSSPAPPGTTSSAILSLLDRYVAAVFSRSLLFALGSAYLIFAIVEVKRLLDSLIEHGRPLSMLLEYLKYFGPGVFGTVLPVSCLFASVVTLTVLGRTGELTAAKAAGMSAHRLAAPIFAMTAALGAALFFVDENVSPFTNRKAQEVRDRIEGRSPRTYGMLPGGRWAFGRGGLLYHYRLYDPATKTFQGLSVYRVDFSRPSILEHRFAESARWDGSGWIVERGWSRTFPEDLSGGGGYERFGTARFEGLDPPDHFARTEKLSLAGDDLSEQTPLADLNRQIAWLEGSGYDTTRLRVAFHSRIARPVTPLVMSLLGIPFALYAGRRGSLYGIGIALALVIAYWAAFAAFTALGAESFLPPVVAAWGANLLFGVVGGTLLLYVRT